MLFFFFELAVFPQIPDDCGVVFSARRANSAA
jgi:hypothetical protein